MKNILFLSIGLLLFSCKSNKQTESNWNDELVNISINTWILDNSELELILSDYIRQVKKASSGFNEYTFIKIWYETINDTTYSIAIMEGFDINNFIYSPPHTLFQFEGKLVCVHIVGLNIFKINDDFLEEFMKKYYPNQYDYYLKLGHYPPIITGGGLVWELEFKNDSLVKKEVYYTQ